MNQPSRYKKIVKETKSIFLIILSVLVFRSMFFEPFRIPSGSMIPTLMIGDFILVNKFSYGLKIPFSDLALSGKLNYNPIYIFGKSDPKRGDVVVFKFPNDPTVNYIKRVVGLPGDTLEIKNKIVYINGSPIIEKLFDGKEIMQDMDDHFKGYNLKFYELKTGEHTHHIQINPENFYKVDHPLTKIPAGKFFMMGDNRDYSYDSRFWGLVSHEQIKGKAFLIWFSLIFPFGDNSTKFRPGRIGIAIN